MVGMAKLFIHGDNIGDVRVILIQENEIIIELQMPVYDDRTYQIQINGHQFNLEFTQIDGVIQTQQKVNYKARGFIFS